VTRIARIAGFALALGTAVASVATVVAGGPAGTDASTAALIPTTVTISGPSGPVGLGDPFQLTAMVSPATAPGFVTFATRNEGIAWGPLFGGVATATVTQALWVGTHEIVAQYDGSANYAFALSEPITVTIVEDRAEPVVTVEVDRTSLLRGDTARFRATVSPLPVTGMMELVDSGSTMYFPTVVRADGVLTVDFAFQGVGTHSVSACYLGDANLQPGCSEPVTVEVAWLPSTTTLSVEPTSIYPDESLTFEVAVDPPPEVASSVAIKSGGGQVRTWVSISPVTGLGTTTIDNGALREFAIGSYGLYAEYDGTNHYQPSRSGSVPLVVHIDEAAFEVDGPPEVVAVGQPVTFTAAVTPVPTEPTAGVGISVTGPPVSGFGDHFALDLGPDGTGVTVIDTDGWPAGDYGWRATFGGDPHLTRAETQGVFTLTDTVPPTGSLEVAGGVTTVITDAVRVDAPATDGEGTGVSVVALSNDGSTWTELAYQPVQTRLWTLGPGDGIRTLHARWRDGAGNWSDPVTATVALNAAGGMLGAPTVRVPAQDSIRSGLVPVRVAWTPGTSTAGVVSYRVERSLDGGHWLPVATATGPALATWIPAGHGVRFRVRAEDATGSAGPWAEAATGRSVTVIRPRSVTWTGRWRTVPDAAAWGGSLRRSTEAGARARVRVTGTGAAWVARTGPTMGVATVWVNGTRAARVDLYSPTWTSQRIVWSAVLGTAKTRTIEIRVVSVPRRTRVDVDALLVIR
jgi:hypothetical protein